MSDYQLLNKYIASWRWLVGFFIGVLHSGEQMAEIGGWKEEWKD
jgi:hypothetical protein